MLSSVLRSLAAIHVNIVRTFVMMRRIVTEYDGSQKRIEELEEDMDVQFNDVDVQFQEIYEAQTVLLSSPQKKASADWFYSTLPPSPCAMMKATRNLSC